MANLTRWRRPSSLSLRREMEDILEDFDLPRGFRRELDRMFDEDLTPRSLWTEMERMFDDFVSPMPLRRRMARLFEPITGAAGLLRRRAEMFVPEVELMERDNAYVLRVDLPGVREQDVNVNVHEDNVLTITGERHRDETRRERGYEYTERSYGSFTRSIQLPRGADTSKIEADFRNGVLEVHVPTKVEAARSRHVPIRGREREREMGEGREGREEPRVLEPGDGGRKERPQANANAPR